MCSTPTEKRIALESSAGAPVATGATADQTPCENCGKLQDTKTAKLQKKKYCSPVCAKTAKTSPAEIVDQTSSASSATATADAASAAAAIKQEKLHAMQTDKADDLKPLKALDIATVKPNQEPLSAVSSAESVQDAGPIKAEQSNAMPAAAAAAAASPAVSQGPQLHEWSVAEVCEFIRALPGCADYAEDFENQEIDGQALLLLKPNNLVSVMNIKLGPALKIIDRVNVLRGAAQDD